MASADRHSLFSRDWIPIGLSQLVAVACGLAGVRLSTRLVPPEQLGVYGLFLSLVPLGTALTHAGLIKHFSRHWVTAPDKPGYLRHWLRHSLRPLAWVPGLGVLAGFAGVLAPETWLGPAILVVATLAGVYALAFQLGVQSAQRYWTDLGLTSIAALTRTFLPLLAFAVTGGRLAALFGGFTLHALILAGAGLLTLRQVTPALPPVSAPAPAESIENYQFFFLLGGGLALANQGMVRWSAGLAFDDVTLGHITLAGNLGMIGPTILAGALWQFSFPRLLATHRAGDPSALRRAGNRVLLVYLGTCLAAAAALFLLLPWLAGWLVAERYLVALPYVLPLFSFGSGLGGLSLIHGELLVLDRPKAGLRVGLVATTLLAVGTFFSASLGLRLFLDWLSLSPLLVLPVAWAVMRRALP